MNEPNKTTKIKQLMPSQNQTKSKQQKLENKKMQNKSQMSIARLSIFLLGLTIIWVMCNQAEHQFQQRFDEDLLSRMGVHQFNSTKLNLAIQIKANSSKQQVQKAANTVDTMLKKIYNLEAQKTQQLVCVVVRDFDKQDTDKDYKTARSILRQDYKNYHIIYLSEEKDPSVERMKSYLISNQILDDKYTFVSAFVDTVDALLRASEKCPQNGVMLILENGEELSSALALKVITANFFNQVDMTWANSLYSNDKLGFSYDYKEDVKKSKDFRKYPLVANDVIAFKNSLLIKNKSAFLDHHVYYPLYMAESFALTLLQKAQGFRYIPEILSFKHKNAKLRVERMELEKKLDQLIRQDKPIMQLLKSVTEASKK